MPDVQARPPFYAFSLQHTLNLGLWYRAADIVLVGTFDFAGREL